MAKCINTILHHQLHLECMATLFVCNQPKIKRMVSGKYNNQPGRWAAVEGDKVISGSVVWNVVIACVSFVVQSKGDFKKQSTCRRKEQSTQKVWLLEALCIVRSCVASNFVGATKCRATFVPMQAKIKNKSM